MDDQSVRPLASLSLTHVNYVSALPLLESLAIPTNLSASESQNPTDPISYMSAFLALVPHRLMIVNCTLIWSTRELETILMFLGQIGCDALNILGKRLIKAEPQKQIKDN